MALAFPGARPLVLGFLGPGGVNRLPEARCLKTGGSELRDPSIGKPLSMLKGLCCSVNI